LSLAIDGGIGLVVDDGLDKIVLVREVVVKLRSADVRRGPDVFEGGASHAALMDQAGGRRNDPGPVAFSLGGELWSLPGVAGHDATIPSSEFDSPLRGWQSGIHDSLLLHILEERP
jgi:hypothetical protein